MFLFSIFNTFDSPTRDIETEAISSGLYKSELWQKEYPRLQILSIEQLVNGFEIEIPLSRPSYKIEDRVPYKSLDQDDLGI